MTLEQLKERIEATCNKHGIFTEKTKLLIFSDGEIEYEFWHNADLFKINMPNTDLLLEAIDLECRAIKARQGIASNGIDE